MPGKKNSVDNYNGGNSNRLKRSPGKFNTTPKNRATRSVNSSASGSSNSSTGSSYITGGNGLRIDRRSVEAASRGYWNDALRLPNTPQGIERGLALERIYKSYRIQNETFLIVKWKDCSMVDAVLLTRLIELYPHLVIEYFETLEMRCVDM